MNTPKQIFCLSDPHCGSDVGLRPPVVRLKNGNENHIGDSAHQQLLWDWWLEAMEWINVTSGSQPFVLLLNGDLIEGIHHGSAEVIATQWDIHMSIAIQTLLPLCQKAAAVVVVRGTEVHTRDLEDALARDLGAEGGEARDQWNFTINGVLNNAQHHMGTTKRTWLESGDLGRVMMNHLSNTDLAGHEGPRVFWRAHRHVSGHWQTRNRHALVCGGWQFLTRYGHKVVGDSIPMPSVWHGDYTNPEHLIFREKVFMPPPEQPLAI